MPPRVSSLSSWPALLASRAARASLASGAEAATPAASGPPAPAPSPEVPLLDAWLHEHAATLWRIVARLGVPAHHVDDVLQETFITALRRHADIRPGQERAFLIGTATRLCSNYRQRAHVRREVSQGEALDAHASREPDAERMLMRKRLRERLERALATLSDDQRAVFVLYELEGLSIPEIAELAQVPLGTVASRLGRARAKFAAAAARLERAHGPLEDP